jgi:hypothetical protein
VASPRNTRDRAARVDAWNAAYRAGQRFQPRRAEGTPKKPARYHWIAAVIGSDLSSTTRLVAHTLVLNGTRDGERIFPGVRKLAEDSRLSERAVCTHLDILVRRGFLGRQARHGDTAGARGFRYLLFIPTVLKDVSHSADRRSESAERRDSSVLKDVSSIHS